MQYSRIQHVVPGIIILALALVVAWLSFTQEPADSFLFPRVISVVFVFLAIWNFTRAVLGIAKVGGGIPLDVAKNIASGLVVILIFVFWAAKALGFYTASFIAFFTIYSIYDPTPIKDVKQWIKRAIATAIFMTVIYGLFFMLLRVQTPRGMFF